MNYLSKDGKWYKTSLEKMTADQAFEKQYNQQQEQNRLLEKQNKLLEEQKEQERLRRAEELKQQQLKINHEKEMLEQKQKHEKELALQKEEHDKKMRLLQLFDKIGLHKSYYDRLESHLTMPYNNELADIIIKKMNLEEELSDLEYEVISNKDTSLPNKYKEKYEQELKKINNTEEKNKQETKEEQLVKQLNTYLPVTITTNGLKTVKRAEHPVQELPDNLIKELSKKTEFINLKEQKQKYNKKALISALLITIPFFGIMLEIGSNYDLIAYLYLILIILFIAGIILFANKSNKCTIKLQKILETEIKTLEKTIQPKETTNNTDIDSIYKKITKEYKDYQEKLTKEIKQLEEKEFNLRKELIKPRLDNFIEFRKNHYNQEIEKLFLDTSLQEKIINLGLNYPRINKDNMIKEGSIEDYITYIDKL